MAAERCAVMLMAYGGPSSLDDVEPYLRDVRGGRPTSPELVLDIRARYARIGGRSPIRELTEAQAASLRRLLGAALPVYVGMRHWHPYIADTIERIVADGHRRLVGIVLAPHYSAMSVGAYERKVTEAVGGRLDVTVVQRWGDHPAFLDVVAAHVRDALARFPDPARVPVIFTAHSLPQRVLADGDPYLDELRASATAVAQRVGLARWHLAFQSAGVAPEPWLGPDAGDVLRALAAEEGGGREALIVPIGFVCDHVEILYDVDVAYRALAGRLGLRLERTASLNDDPLLIACLADLARRAAAQRGWL
jgi:protoporphyrin/coproporphyrin ferrochelatase